LLKISGTFARLLFALSLAALLLSDTIGGAINSRWLYQYGFQKYQVSETTGLAPAELEEAARGLIRYFNSNEELISLTATKDGQSFPLFNQREVIHLKDVKGLVWLDYRMLMGASLYILIYALGVFLSRTRKWRSLAGGVLGGSALTLGLMLALGLGAIFSFEQLFLQFHRLSFTNDFWQLDPARDYLIMLFPQGFWFDAFSFCAIAAAVVAVALGVVSWLYLKKSGTG
jgi:integral membrane protein (TIGR01906 family)